MKKRTDLQKLFVNRELLNQALTHRSWINENAPKRQSNERLEFLGDAILEFIVSNYLFNKLPDKEEGFLTALRANIVNTKNLSKLAKKLDLGKALYLSKGEEQGGGRSNKSLLANTVEALIGALFLDQGFEKAQDFIQEHLLSDLTEKLKEPLKDPKSRLQEEIQSQGLPAPKYNILAETGPDHAKEFTVEVVINQRSVAKGTGKSKHEAEEAAAAFALEALKTKD